MLLTISGLKAVLHIIWTGGGAVWTIKETYIFLSCLSIVVRLWNTSKIFHTVVIFAVTNMHCLRLSGAKVCLLHVTHPFITICDSEYMYFQKKNWSNTCMCCFILSSCIKVSTFAKKSCPLLKKKKSCPLLQRNRRLIFILFFYIYVVFSLSFYVLYMSTCIQVEKTKHGNLISSVPFDNQSKLSSSAAN